MSKDAVAGFIEKVDKDAGVQEALTAAVQGQENHTAAIVDYAAALGYDFTAEEFTELIDAVSQYQHGDLSDEDLDRVAGGTALSPYRAQVHSLARTPRLLKIFDLAMVR